jgi:arylsulfatase
VIVIDASTPNKTENGFYSSDAYADKFIEYLDSPARGKDQPFFGYLAFPAPHWPLQCPKQVRDKYKGMYEHV